MKIHCVTRKHALAAKNLCNRKHENTLRYKETCVRIKFGRSSTYTMTVYALKPCHMLRATSTSAELRHFTSVNDTNFDPRIINIISKRWFQSIRNILILSEREIQHTFFREQSL